MRPREVGGICSLNSDCRIRAADLFQQTREMQKEIESIAEQRDELAKRSLDLTSKIRAIHEKLFKP
jgi:hypothetical protein